MLFHSTVCALVDLFIFKNAHLSCFFSFNLLYKNCQKCVEKKAILKMWMKLNYTHFLFVLLKQLPAALCVLTLGCI